MHRLQSRLKSTTTAGVQNAPEQNILCYVTFFIIIILLSPVSLHHHSAKHTLSSLTIYISSSSSEIKIRIIILYKIKILCTYEIRSKQASHSHLTLHFPQHETNSFTGIIKKKGPFVLGILLEKTIVFYF